MAPKITTLDNGLRIVTEQKPFHTVVIGAWVDVGSDNEPEHLNGISHFLEHMAFKGTKTKNAQELADWIEALGGDCNAYTCNLRTAYHVSLLPEYWKQGVDFLGDILQNSVFPEDELEMERNVIIQEILRANDNPNHVLWDKFMMNTYPNSAIGRSTLGTIENIERITRQDLLDYMKSKYAFDSIIVSACGDIDHDEFVEYVKNVFVDFVDKSDKVITTTDFNENTTYVESKFDQAQVLMAVDHKDCIDDSVTSKRMLFSNILNGMSNRLFQEVREKRGLAYSVGFTTIEGNTYGMLGVFAGVSPEKVDETISVCKEVLESMKTNITEEELQKAKNVALHNIASFADNVGGIASFNAEELFFYKKIHTVDEIINDIRQVTIKDIYDFANKYLNGKYSITVLK